MKDDPIIDEVRKHRLARAAKFNFDIDAIAADARKRERTSKRRIVPPPRKRSSRGSDKAGLRK